MKYFKIFLVSILLITGCGQKDMSVDTMVNNKMNLDEWFFLVDHQLALFRFTHHRSAVFWIVDKKIYPNNIWSFTKKNLKTWDVRIFYKLSIDTYANRFDLFRWDLEVYNSVLDKWQTLGGQFDYSTGEFINNNGEPKIINFSFIIGDVNEF